MPKQQKEQQLATNRAKLQQAKVEQDERRAEEAAMKRPPGRPKKDFSLTSQLGCGYTGRAQGHSLAGAMAEEDQAATLALAEQVRAAQQLAEEQTSHAPRLTHPSSTISMRKQQPQQQQRGGQQQQQ